MEFRYRYRTKPSDIWQVRMYYAYASYTGIVNIICIVASVILIVTMWETAAGWFRVLMLFFLSLFTIIQPLVIYSASKKQAADNTDEIEIVFNNSGIEVSIADKNESYPWKDVISVVIKPTLVIIYTGTNRGYILTNSVLNKTRKAFLEFVDEHRIRERV